MTSPLTSCSDSGLTLSRFIPFSSTPMMSTPSRVPDRVPVPPEKLVPPRTTAAIAPNSYPTPAPG